MFWKLIKSRLQTTGADAGLDQGWKVLIWKPNLLVVLRQLRRPPPFPGIYRAGRCCWKSGGKKPRDFPAAGKLLPASGFPTLLFRAECVLRISNTICVLLKEVQHTKKLNYFLD